MPISSPSLPRWLTSWTKAQKIPLWGVADLRGFSTPVDATGQGYPFAISFAIPMNPMIMADIQDGPNQAYADAYARVNDQINELAKKLTAEIKARGFRAQPLAASKRTDKENIKGDFPHKTAATRAGLAGLAPTASLLPVIWSMDCLGTVFTDMTIPCGQPVKRDSCGRCTRCVDACPAGASREMPGIRDCRARTCWMPVPAIDGK